MMISGVDSDLQYGDLPIPRAKPTVVTAGRNNSRVAADSTESHGSLPVGPSFSLELLPVSAEPMA